MNSYFFKIISTCCVVSFSVGCGNVAPNYDHREQVIEVLRTYRDAISGKDAAAALPLVSQQSLERFEEFRDWAIHDSPDELKQRSLYEQIHVLSLRHHLGGKDLSHMDGSQILAELIRSGSMSTNLLANARFGNSVFDHSRKLCFVRLYEDGLPTKHCITCLQEETDWKVHLIGMEEIETKSYEAIMENRDMTQDDLLEKIVSDWTKGNNTVNLWHPLKSRKNQGNRHADRRPHPVGQLPPNLYRD